MFSAILKTYSISKLNHFYFKIACSNPLRLPTHSNTPPTLPVNVNFKLWESSTASGCDHVGGHNTLRFPTHSNTPPSLPINVDFKLWESSKATGGDHVGGRACTWGGFVWDNVNVNKF